MAASEVYILDSHIADFFTKTSVTREVCDVKAVELVGGSITPVPNQGDCSYTVYGGPYSEFAVQFRLKSLLLDLEKAALAQEIHGALVSNVTFHGQLGDADQEEDREPLLVYVLSQHARRPVH
ncbi:hypothetical protein H2199_007422 [Coniosporium tulheliwenetii]|uniref:Uncharacterized protein n=1 Tax=Coniosporium tulheliwenetii TaxID=3383036 RepID=A0ACC2YP94_9PEZI|nr:hypothetical protein H2199_007422 [Cladosporium sp. JES 115]